MTDIANLWRYDLRRGTTDHPANGACLFDAGMWLVYGKVGDNPPCSCPVIRAYAIGLNDGMDDMQRQRLKPFILRVVGNRDPDAEAARLRYIVLNTARRVLPVMLDNFPKHKTRLQSLSDDATYLAIRAAARAASDAAAQAAYAAAHAAADAAAAVSAAHAARAAVSAAHAARAAFSAAADDLVWSAAINILDGALRIGKQSPEFDETQVRASIAAFELARS